MPPRTFYRTTRDSFVKRTDGDVHTLTCLTYLSIGFASRRNINSDKKKPPREIVNVKPQTVFAGFPGQCCAELFPLGTGYYLISGPNESIV